MLFIEFMYVTALSGITLPCILLDNVTLSDCEAELPIGFDCPHMQMIDGNIYIR